jgi:hypothetical protein
MKTRPFPDRQRGTFLIVAMLLCAIIGISLVSYYKLASTSLKTATRTFLASGNVNLAESGIEQAMACFYAQSTGVASATAWAGWTLSGVTAKRTFSGFTPAPNASGVVSVYVNYYTNSGGIPVIVAKATTTPPDGPVIDKYVEVTLRSRSLWSNGIVAKDSITGDSNLVVDSWQSGATSPATLYASGVRRANGPIGVVASTSGALSVGDNPTIYGSAKTGGAAVSKTGSAKLTSTVGGSGWNSALESHDFAFTFPAITVPAPATVNTVSSNVTANITFPRSGDYMNADGKYYYNWGSNINSYASSTMTITAPCVFIMTPIAATTNTITTSSGATWTYGNSTATVEIYTSGSMYFDSGASFFANGVPSRCIIYFTAASGSQFHTGGGGTWSACIYGPNTAFNIDSGGDFRGSVIMKSCVLRGGMGFHYDETLATLGSGSGVAVAQWRELQTADERNVYASQFTP